MDSLLFGSGLEGLTLLDIGSSLGHFCLEALKHGAAGATGLETSPERIRHAREIARLMNLPAEYIEADFEDYVPSRNRSTSCSASTCFTISMSRSGRSGRSCR
ncbi:class I SAM-dependent methyltransferase [Sphingomonas daechungensis]|uniref:Class I SAM-dependent methyltransferase n=1 Tax=Sphingomonas daechungensis TaxID=1176646 RepID=A0ABX6T3C6_9SPHN|nr:class I SAM-dependent methyltransferase [Sphingomonas daechungensis]QNP43966.1 class I SAM-dependent methyltransferase [Sphingomonas daechungensis]